MDNKQEPSLLCCLYAKARSSMCPFEPYVLWGFFCMQQYVTAGAVVSSSWRESEGVGFEEPIL